MLFNSIEFLLFFPTVALLFFLTPKKFRWLPLLVANYFFYSMIKIEYLAIIISQTLITFLGAIAVSKQSDGKLKFRFYLLTLMINVLTLVFFKYTDFVLESFVNLLKVFNSGANDISLGIILPIGISFYTFQIIGYLTDVYWEQIEPETHLGKFAIFISFFPQLLAGPIERANRILPQINNPSSFDINNLIVGIKWFIVGMFYKVVVADRLSIYVNTIYGNSDVHGGGSFIFATLSFTFQIYGDFAGYSFMAIGCAKILGIDLINNFNYPYFSKSISEFWNRWHISLSTWLRDYIFTPLTYNRLFGVSFDSYRVELSVIITFLISGLWHGANWNFIFWGFLNGLFIVIGIKSKMYRKGLIDRFGLSSKIFTVFLPWIFTFVLLNVMWMFFRSDSIMMGFETIIKIVTSPTSFFIGSRAQIFYSLVAVFLLIIYELLKFFGFDEEKTILRSSVFYITLFFLIILFGVFNGSQFIYFQF
jgi:alginate O-acetyltransferase complex protein AlgI